LDRNNINKKIKEQIIQLLNIIIEQNYFHYNNQFFRPANGIAMGSPISGTLVEIYLQLIEELYIKHWIESQKIVYYKRYVDDILIIFDQHITNETTITSVINNINEQLDFKATREINKSINYLDLTINRNINNIE
jgi:retron-type reverse transcriptase